MWVSVFIESCWLLLVPALVFIPKEVLPPPQSTLKHMRDTDVSFVWRWADNNTDHKYHLKKPEWNKRLSRPGNKCSWVAGKTCGGLCNNGSRSLMQRRPTLFVLTTEELYGSCNMGFDGEIHGYGFWSCFSTCFRILQQYYKSWGYQCWPLTGLWPSKRKYNCTLIKLMKKREEKWERTVVSAGFQLLAHYRLCREDTMKEGKERGREKTLWKREGANYCMAHKALWDKHRRCHSRIKERIQMAGAVCCSAPDCSFNDTGQQVPCVS